MYYDLLRNILNSFKHTMFHNFQKTIAFVTLVINLIVQVAGENAGVSSDNRLKDFYDFVIGKVKE